MAQILPLSMEYRLDSRPPGFRVVELLRSESSRVGAGGADNATMRTWVVRLEAPVVSEDLPAANVSTARL
jgi:hypothetical protein